MSNPREKLLNWSVGICHGSDQPSSGVEEPVGLRDCLFCVGIYISRHSRWRSRGSTVSFGGNALFGCGARAVWLDARARRAFAKSPRMGVRIPAGNADLCLRLWAALLGRAARAFRNRRGNAGDDPGLYGAFGNHFLANAEADSAVGVRAPRRDCRSRGAGGPLAELGRSADR